MCVAASKFGDQPHLNSRYDFDLLAFNRPTKKDKI
jgi:hypothetical protein